MQIDDLQRAKKRLVGHTLVLCKGGDVYTSDKRGVSPMLDCIESGLDVNGFCAADTIVGKAVASMFAKSGIAGVYAQVLSQSGLNYLTNHGVYVEYGALVERIINRQGTGSCPMEEAVESIEDANECYLTIKAKLAALRANG